MIDRSGQWWTGEDFGDLAEHLRVVTAEGYPANRIRQSVCRCGGTTHRLDADPLESVAQRTCVACGTSAFIADSDEHWSEARAERWHCACENDTAELGVAFSLRSDGEVRWITLGQRCTRCGLLDAVVDWKIDYGPAPTCSPRSRPRLQAVSTRPSRWAQISAQARCRNAVRRSARRS